MEADLILQALKDHLTPKVEAAGGRLDVAEDPWEVVDLLKVSPERWRVVLSIEDEASPDALNTGGWTTGTLAVYVQMHKGFKADRGAQIYKSKASGSPSHLAAAAKVRRWIRAIEFPLNDDIACDNGESFHFSGAQWVDGAQEKDKPWRVRRLDFEIVYALDDPATDADPDGDDVVIPSALRISGISEDGLFYLLTANGQPAGRVPRFEGAEGDPGGNGTGWRILEAPEDPAFYVVALGGVAHGRIQRYEAEE